MNEHRKPLNVLARKHGLPELCDNLEVPQYVGRALDILCAELGLVKPVSPNDPQNTYLGDGVHASFDGYQIWLGLFPNQQLIALEPHVMAALVRYADRVFGRRDKAPLAPPPAPGTV